MFSLLLSTPDAGVEVELRSLVQHTFLRADPPLSTGVQEVVDEALRRLTHSHATLRARIHAEARDHLLARCAEILLARLVTPAELRGGSLSFDDTPALVAVTNGGGVQDLEYEIYEIFGIGGGSESSWCALLPRFAADALLRTLFDHTTVQTLCAPDLEHARLAASLWITDPSSSLAAAAAAASRALAICELPAST